MISEQRLTRKIVLGTTLVALAVLVGMLLWTRPGGPHGETTAAPNAEDKPEGFIGADLQLGGKAESITELPEADRRIVPDALAPIRGTSLLVRVVERGTSTPVPRFGVLLFPENSVPFGEKALEGVTDDQGEVFWENITWDSVLVYPSLTRDWVTLEEGQLNELVHEVELVFSIQGEVVDSRGQPFEGAEVWTCVDNALSFMAPAQVAVSDARGTFSFPVLSSKMTMVFAKARGRAASRVARVSRPEEGEVARLRLGIGDEAGTIVGNVVTPEGMAIHGAEIRVRDSTAFLPPQEDPNMRIRGQETVFPSLPVRTGTTGQFRVEDVAAGQATVMVTAPGWAGTRAKVDVVPGGTSSVRISTNKGARIVGAIRDTNGQPVAGVMVVARRHTFALRTTNTDREGRYALDNVQPGFMYLEATHSTRGSSRDRVDLAAGEEFRWEPVFSAGADLRGVVQDHGGTPLGEAWVTIRGEDDEFRQVQTDPEGRFVFPQCKDQAYEILANPPGFARMTIATGIRPGGEEKTFRLPELPAADAHLIGRVLNFMGEPVSPVSIGARETMYGDYAGHDLEAADGTFRLGPLIAGEWTLSFDSTRYPKLDRTVTLAAGKVTDLGDIMLEESAPLQVLVRKPGGIQGSIYAQLWGPGKDYLRPRVESGHVILPPLRPGLYTLQVSGEHAAPEVRELELVAGRETRLEIDLQPGIVRSLDIELPEDTESSLLRFTTFDASGRELVSWSRNWYSSWGVSPVTFRPEAVRLVVTDEDGGQAESGLGSPEKILLVLR